jgi:hypothetical protein
MDFGAADILEIDAEQMDFDDSPSPTPDERTYAAVLKGDTSLPSPKVQPSSTQQKKRSQPYHRQRKHGEHQQPQRRRRGCVGHRLSRRGAQAADHPPVSETFDAPSHKSNYFTTRQSAINQLPMYELPSTPPPFDRVLNDARPLLELQQTEQLVDPLSILEPDEPTMLALGTKDSRRRLRFAIMMLTHSETRLGYSYQPIDFTEQHLVGVSLLSESFVDSFCAPAPSSLPLVDHQPKRSMLWCDQDEDDEEEETADTEEAVITLQDTTHVRGIILRKNCREYIPYRQYQAQLNSLIVRDKFFNEQNMPSLRHVDITCDPMLALRKAAILPTTEDHDQSSTVYSVCEIPSSQHMLSVGFPMLCDYAKVWNIRVIGHRLPPKLAWIAGAFENYCEKHGWKLICRKIDLKVSGLSICADCANRIDHTTSSCEICVFHAYAKLLRQRYEATPCDPPPAIVPIQK